MKDDGYNLFKYNNDVIIKKLIILYKDIIMADSNYMSYKKLQDLSAFNLEDRDKPHCDHDVFLVIVQVSVGSAKPYKIKRYLMKVFNGLEWNIHPLW